MVARRLKSIQSCVSKDNSGGESYPSRKQPLKPPRGKRHLRISWIHQAVVFFVQALTALDFSVWYFKSHNYSKLGL